MNEPALRCGGYSLLLVLSGGGRVGDEADEADEEAVEEDMGASWRIRF